MYIKSKSYVGYLDRIYKTTTTTNPISRLSPFPLHLNGFQNLCKSGFIWHTHTRTTIEILSLSSLIQLELEESTMILHFLA